MSRSASKSTVPQHVMTAVVLGTALSALNMGGALAEPLPDTVNDLSRYCTACWRNARLPADCWTDCTQEVLVRLLERLPAPTWDRALRDDEGDERRELVRAIDTVKKRVQRGKKYASYEHDFAADPRPALESRRADLREQVFHAADEVLSDRQRRILELSVEGYSVQEIADRLAVGPERVSDEKYKAIKRLRRHLGVEAGAAASA